MYSILKSISFKADDILDKINKNTALIIINSPGNPTGGIIPKKELDHLVKGLEKHEHVILMSDEIYDQFCFGTNIDASFRVKMDGVVAEKHEESEHRAQLDRTSRTHGRNMASQYLQKCQTKRMHRPIGGTPHHHSALLRQSFHFLLISFFSFVARLGRGGGGLVTQLGVTARVSQGTLGKEAIVSHF